MATLENTLPMAMIRSMMHLLQRVEAQSSVNAAESSQWQRTRRPLALAMARRRAVRARGLMAHRRDRQPKPHNRITKRVRSCEWGGPEDSGELRLRRRWCTFRVSQTILNTVIWSATHTTSRIDTRWTTIQTDDLTRCDTYLVTRRWPNIHLRRR
jgi:hypothetical protein